MSLRTWLFGGPVKVAAPADDVIEERESGMPKCTYCGGTDWFSGPSGGMSTNILCANTKCRHWFNYTSPPFDTLDDLKKVEPTEAEATKAQSDARAEADAARLARYAEGAKAFEDGRLSGTLRIDPGYGGYAEAAHNIERICGFLDAMALDVRGHPREIIPELKHLFDVKQVTQRDPILTPSVTLRVLKTLRDMLNDVPDHEWTNPVLEVIDKATDIIEFPSETMKPLLEAAERAK